MCVITICCKWPMISNLRSSENAPAYDGCSEWGRYTGNCKFLLRWFRHGFSWSSYVCASILYLATFSESNAWDFHLVMTDISGNVPATSEDFRRITEDFRTLPKIKCPQMFQKTFEHFRSYLKDDTFSVLWYDFVRTQKRTQSHRVLRTICLDLWVRREKLSLMFNWHYMCLLSQILLQKYTNKFHS